MSKVVEVMAVQAFKAFYHPDIGDFWTTEQRDECFSVAKRQLEALRAAGYVVVTREATPAMHLNSAMRNDIWTAMIAAAEKEDTP